MARNGLGTWSGATPASFEVAIGGDTLSIECAHEGYRTETRQLKCIRPDVRTTATGAFVGLHLGAALGPAAFLVAPAAIVAGLVGATAAGAAVGRAVAGPHPEVCNYGQGSRVELRITLMPE